MTRDELALLRGVLLAPEDDLPRLVYADWLEERGRPERAEFIHVQCELAAIPAKKTVACRRRGCLGYSLPNADAGNAACAPCRKLQKRKDALRRRERELLLAHRNEWLAGTPFRWPPDDEPVPYGIAHWIVPDEPNWERGFVSSFRKSADWFFRHADALLWSPDQKCLSCGGHWEKARGKKRKCPDCGGSGNRPCPPTAQPVVKVVLTTRPTREQFREYGILEGEDEAKDGTRTRWCTFDRFPGVEFELPPEPPVYLVHWPEGVANPDADFSIGVAEGDPEARLRWLRGGLARPTPRAGGAP